MGAAEANILMHPTGTCITIEGPRFSSKAESTLFKSWGCDVINMTTVPEVILAKEAGLCYAAIALATFRENVSKVTNIICTAIPIIAKQHWSGTIEALHKTVKDSIML